MLGNAAALVPFQDPDTDSRRIIIANGSASVTMNLMHDHTRVEYVVPVGNDVPVVFNAPINTEDRSLHWLVLDNSNNATTKEFTFAPSFVFAAGAVPATNTVISLLPGKKAVWYCAYIAGVMHMRDSVESDL
jgi:hypothetical protein